MERQNKESGGKHWTHDTEDCFVKDRADARKKESNAMDAMHKQMTEMASVIQSLKSKLSSDGESDWLHPEAKLVAAKKVGKTRIKIKN